MNAITTHYFLGANSKNGFCSLYDHFVSLEKGDFLWVVKGGPGCGKSSLMKKIASAALDAGCNAECIHCSGDPLSFDGIYVPEKRIAFVDGTAPHISEAQYPGAGSLYLDLGQFYDRDALRQFLPEIIAVNRRYKALYERAYDCIAAANAVSIENYPSLVGKKELTAAMRRAERMADREFGKTRQDTKPVQTYRFVSAFTYEGLVRFEETIRTLCPRICVVDNQYGLASPYILTLMHAAEKRGLSSVVCPDPIDPDKFDALLLPQLGLAFVTAPLEGEYYRHIRLDALVDRDRLRELRPKLRRAEKLKENLLLDAQTLLMEAKRLHDELEAIYNPFVDFHGVYQTAERLKKDIFGGN